MNDINNDGFKKVEKYAIELFSKVAEQFNISYTKSVINGLIAVVDQQGSEVNLNICNCPYYEENNKKVFFDFKQFHAIDNFIENHIVGSIREYFLQNKSNLLQCLESLKEESKLFRAVDDIKKNTNISIDEHLDMFCEKKLKLVNVLSATKYEKSTCNGNIVFFDDKSEVNYISSFKYHNDNQRIYFKEENKRIIRKLLEIATGHIALGLEKEQDEDCYYLKGYVNLNDDCCNKKIHFGGLSHIEFYDENKLLVKYVDGNYCKNEISMFTDKDLENIMEFFNVKDTINKDNFDAFMKYSNDVHNCDQFHGAIIIITDDNDSFIEHMISFGCGIIPESSDKLNLFNIYGETSSTNLKKELLQKVSCIDGAVIFDNTGKLKLYGAILDGLARSRAQMENGSRFNSVKTFIEYYHSESMINEKNNKYLAIVMSENGPVKTFYR